MLALIRSILHMAWMVITVIPWTLAVLLVSLFSRRAAWWTAVNWFSVVMWGTRVFDINSVADVDGRHDEMELLCTEKV